MSIRWISPFASRLSAPPSLGQQINLLRPTCRLFVELLNGVAREELRRFSVVEWRFTMSFYVFISRRGSHRDGQSEVS